MTRKIICDAVHGIMSFQPKVYKELKKIINTKYFQRLRHIKQLSFAEFAYPGAVHNRFSHSLGASYLSTLVFSAVFNENDSYEKYEIPLAIAALVHDIGHGPFSHVFETIINNDLKEKIKHEDWVKVFLEKIGDQSNCDHIKRAQKILIQEQGEEKKWKLLRSIISSQLDVDRFDYLLRDSHFCGVRYGVYDLDWLIDCLCQRDEVLCIDEKGINSVEHYIMARRLMNKNVYFHKIKCAAEYLLKVIFRIISSDLYSLSDKYIELKGHPVINFLKALSENKSEKKDILIRRVFDSYSNLTDIEIWSLLKTISLIDFEEAPKKHLLLKQISQNLVARELPKIYKVKIGYSTYVKSEITKFINKQNGISEYVLNFEPEGFAGYKTKGEEIFYADATSEKGYRNVLAQSSILKTTQSEKVRYLYRIVTPEIDLDIDQSIEVKLRDLEDKGYIIPCPSGESGVMYA